MSNPETCRSLVSVKKTKRRPRHDDQVTIDDVISLNRIFNEDRMAHSIVNYVVYYVEILDGVNSHCAIVSLMDRITLHQRLRDSTDDVEMNRISAEFESLANIKELNVKDTSNTGLVLREVEHDVSAILIFG